jgi:esterase/lipase
MIWPTSIIQNMISKKIKVIGEVLHTSLFNTENTRIPEVLILHGGSKDSSNLIYLAEKLQSNGQCSLIFDHSGHGKSTGKIFQSSLEKRVREGKELLKEFKVQEPITVIGFSMGAHVALKLAEEVPVDNIILFCPAIYDRRAFKRFFGEEFTYIIRQQDSWKNSDVFKFLEKYTGKLTIIIGDKDDIIPSEVVEQLEWHAPEAEKQTLILPDCTHAINEYLKSNPSEFERVLTAILSTFHASEEE